MEAVQFAINRTNEHLPVAYRIFMDGKLFRTLPAKSDNVVLVAPDIVGHTYSIVAAYVWGDYPVDAQYRIYRDGETVTGIHISMGNLCNRRC